MHIWSHCAYGTLNDPRFQALLHSCLIEGTWHPVSGNGVNLGVKLSAFFRSMNRFSFTKCCTNLVNYRRVKGWYFLAFKTNYFWVYKKLVSENSI